MKKKCMTIYSAAFVEYDTAVTLYFSLKNTIQWEPFVRDGRVVSKGKVIHLNEYQDVLDLVMCCLDKMAERSYSVYSIHLNLYETGNMRLPYSTHTGTHHLIIALGCTRTLLIGKNLYKLNNGDAILFGYGYYQLPPEPTLDGTILITVFMQPVGPR